MTAIMPVSGIDPLTQTTTSALQPQAAGAAVAPAGEASFGEVMASYMANARNSVTQAETVAMQGIMGEVSHREVAEAVLSAERSLKAASAIRDKIVTSYLEISRMQI